MSQDCNVFNILNFCNIYNWFFKSKSKEISNNVLNTQNNSEQNPNAQNNSEQNLNAQNNSEQNYAQNINAKLMQILETLFLWKSN